MSISISDFKNSFNGGMRSNRYMVEGAIPFGNGQLSHFHIKATTIPPVTTTRIEYPYFGRKAFYPGEKQYGSWSVIILDDTGDTGNLWKKFSNWQNEINNHQTNISSIPTSVVDYKAYNWKIRHLKLNGEVDDTHKSYVMHGCWPKTIEPIALNMGAGSLINFSVVFVMDWIEIEGITDVVPQ